MVYPHPSFVFSHQSPSLFKTRKIPRTASPNSEKRLSFLLPESIKRISILLLTISSSLLFPNFLCRFNAPKKRGSTMPFSHSRIKAETPLLQEVSLPPPFSFMIFLAAHHFIARFFLCTSVSLICWLCFSHANSFSFLLADSIIFFIFDVTGFQTVVCETQKWFGMESRCSRYRWLFSIVFSLFSVLSNVLLKGPSFLFLPRTASHLQSSSCLSSNAFVSFPLF